MDHSINKNTKIYDLTAQLCEQTTVFPGSPSFSSKELYSLSKGSVYGLCHLSMANHSGTHIDYPGHVIKGGKLSHNFPLNWLIGTGVLVKIPDTEPAITKQIVNSIKIQPGDMILFATSNSYISKKGQLCKQFVYIEVEAALLLIQKKVKLVGIDYLSIDKFDSTGLPVHKLLLEKDILVVQNLELNNIPPGRYEVWAIPLNIPNMDGLPARIFCKPLTVDS